MCPRALFLARVATQEPHRVVTVLRDHLRRAVSVKVVAVRLFNDLPEKESHAGGVLLGEPLIALKREAEARTVLMKTYEYCARTYGEPNPGAVRARQRLEQLGDPKASTSK